MKGIRRVQLGNCCRKKPVTENVIGIRGLPSQERDERIVGIVGGLKVLFFIVMV